MPKAVSDKTLRWLRHNYSVKDFHEPFTYDGDGRRIKNTGEVYLVKLILRGQQDGCMSEFDVSNDVETRRLDVKRLGQLTRMYGLWKPKPRSNGHVASAAPDTIREPTQKVQVLPEDEWRTLAKHGVRPTSKVSAAFRKGLTPDTRCYYCGLRGTKTNLFRHRIVLRHLGYKRYGVAPLWLDQSGNLVWAHRDGCNKRVELPDEIALRVLLTIDPSFELPAYLPRQMQTKWRRVKARLLRENSGVA